MKEKKRRKINDNTTLIILKLFNHIQQLVTVEPICEPVYLNFFLHKKGLVYNLVNKFIFLLSGVS